jgi:FtsP/CotA-like multicopper oxidase with cupredoxin domain
LSAPLIIRDGSENPSRQEVVVMLADFSFTPPDQILAQLQAHRTPDMHGMDIRGMATPATKSEPDLNDVRYDACLANSRTLADPEVVRVELGGRVRLRIINASSMSAYHIDLGRLKGNLIAVDGIPVQPVRGHNFPITVAQRLDIELTIPKIAAAYPVLAVLEGERRPTGIVLLAGKGQVSRISGLARAASPPLTLGLERSLRAAERLVDRKSDRTHRVNLTGSMQGYQWSINNVAWTKDVPPLMVSEGERVELVMTNQTMMSHPMHLRRARHGVGASENDRDRGFRRRQSGMVGFSLPPFVPSARGHVSNCALRLNTPRGPSWQELRRLIAQMCTARPDPERSALAPGELFTLERRPRVGV